MEEYSNVESQVDYGLEKIDPDRKIEVNLKDFLYLQNVIGEFIRFFHRPMHWETFEDVDRFIGNRSEGALHLLWECYYRKFRYSDVFPQDIIEMIDNSEFENPIPPYYFKPRN